ncbi:MAG TPA: VWA domain-containing protein [Pyrinomonadaceae bacterium]|nr:VWA domain-containing protein [Pyrinomonadaceae bacterium]
MRSQTAHLCLAALICAGLSLVTTAQTREPSPRQTVKQPEAPQELETLRINTSLVTVPVVAADANGLYTADLRQEEFEVWEDGVKQEIAFFATVTTPFHVVLMLDTSASTKEKLGSIQKAAVAFVEQLQPADRVKIVSFDDEVRDLNEFTNDRARLKEAINRTRSGEGTKLYDAFSFALDSMRRIRGRKAIVLFSDGVDWHSDLATFDSTCRGIDEEDVIVYPIRFNTRAETERLLRQQAEEQGPQLPTINVIRTPPTGTTAPTFPSDDPGSVPTAGTRNKTGPMGLPLPGEILRRRRGRDPDVDRYPSPDTLPPEPRGAPDPRREPLPRGSRPSSRSDDSIAGMLDQLYLTADSYLTELTRKTGGRLLLADTVGSLPDAFANIAAELRTQYTLGYYPSNKVRDGQYRKIKVGTKRKNVVIRARPGYLSAHSG